MWYFIIIIVLFFVCLHFYDKSQDKKSEKRIKETIKKQQEEYYKKEKEQCEKAYEERKKKQQEEEKLKLDKTDELKPNVMNEYIVLNIERENADSVLVYARKKGYMPYDAPNTFLVQKNGDLHKSAEKAMYTNTYWQVSLEKFKHSEVYINRYEELVKIDAEEIIAKAIDIAIKAKFSDVNSMFAGVVSDEELLENVSGSLQGNIKVFEAHVTTTNNGYVFMNHDLKPVYAINDDEAFKVVLSILQQRERREVTEEELLSCVIVHNGRIVMNETYSL